MVEFLGDKILKMAPKSCHFTYTLFLNYSFLFGVIDAHIFGFCSSRYSPLLFCSLNPISFGSSGFRFFSKWLGQITMAQYFAGVGR